MNVIGNSCASCFIQTQFFNHELLNPFSYNIIDFESFSYLINNYDNINFENISFYLKDNYVMGNLENKILINFVHYKFDKNAKTVINDKNNDVRYYNILEYVKTKWCERVKRIKNSEPIFLAASFTNNSVNNYTDNEIIALLKNKSKYKIIVAYEKSIDFKSNNDREYIFLNRNEIKGNCTNGRALAGYICKKSKILNFLK